MEEKERVNLVEASENEGAIRKDKKDIQGKEEKAVTKSLHLSYQLTTEYGFRFGFTLTVSIPLPLHSVPLIHLPFSCSGKRNIKTGETHPAQR